MFSNYKTIDQKQNLNFSDMLKTIVKLLFLLFIIVTIVGIVFRDYFKERKELIDSYDIIIQDQARIILGDIFGTTVTIKALKKEINTALSVVPKKTYGNNIYEVGISKSNDTFLVYWELIEDIPEIKRIERRNTKEIVYKNEYIDINANGHIDEWRETR